MSNNNNKRKWEDDGDKENNNGKKFPRLIDSQPNSLLLLEEVMEFREEVRELAPIVDQIVAKVQKEGMGGKGPHCLGLYIVVKRLSGLIRQTIQLMETADGYPNSCKVAAKAKLALITIYNMLAAMHGRLGNILEDIED